MSRPAPSFPPGYADEYIGDTLRDVGIAFTVIEILAVGLRYTAAFIGRKKFGLDDYLSLPGLLFCLGVNTTALVSIRLGYVGYHYDVVAAYHPKALVSWSKTLIAIPILYSAACAVPRFILLTLYLRIFTLRPYKIACYTLMGIVIALAIADILVGALQCIPLAYFWDRSIEGGSCIDIPRFFRWGTLPNAIIDLLMLILPQPVVWKLQTSIQTKIGLALTFLTGSVGLITSILRCVAFFQNDPLKDGTWISVTFLNWSIIEPGVYLIAACLPSYRPLFKAILPRQPSSATTRQSDSYSKLSGMKNSRLGGQRSVDSYEDTVPLDVYHTRRNGVLEE